MMDISRRCSIVLILLIISSSPNAAEPPPIVHNPFSRPPSDVQIASPKQTLADGSIQALDLRATMVTATSGLANVSGRILRPGDESQGYVLLKVFEDRAIFIREGQRLTIYVKPPLVDDDE